MAELTNVLNLWQGIVKKKRCEGIRIPKSGKFLFVESEIRENFACEIGNPWLWNPEYSSQNSGIPQTIGIQNPSSTD